MVQSLGFAPIQGFREPLFMRLSEGQMILAIAKITDDISCSVLHTLGVRSY